MDTTQKNSALTLTPQQKPAEAAPLLAPLEILSNAAQALLKVQSEWAAALFGDLIVNRPPLFRAGGSADTWVHPLVTLSDHSVFLTQALVGVWSVLSHTYEELLACVAPQASGGSDATDTSR